MCIVNEINGLKNIKDSLCLADNMREGKSEIYLIKCLSFKDKRLTNMKIDGATYSTQALSALMPQERSDDRTELVKGAFVDQTDRFEPSRAVMGAADALPGQASTKFQVTGDFGFCQNCGASHGVSASKEDKSAKTPEIDGKQIPDVHEILGASETEEAGVNLLDETDPEQATEPERDTLTGEVELKDKEKQEVEELKRRDQEVRTHEQAHVAAGGQHVRGGISYEYQTGPDGKRYAVGGEVSIDTSPENKPEDTIRKAQMIRQAALAPAEPSGQDRKAAAAAAQMELKARQEIVEAKMEGGEVDSDEVADVLGASSEHDTDKNAVSTDLPQGQTVEGQNKSASEIIEGGLREAEGLSVPDISKQKQGALFQGGLDVGRQKEKGLPEVASLAPPPAVKLDYAQQKRAGGLVDMYG